MFYFDKLLWHYWTVKNSIISLITCSLIASCYVGEAMVIDSDWAFKKSNKIKWGDNNCVNIRDNEELKKLHADICYTFKTTVVDSFNSGTTGVNLRPPVGYHKKAAEIYIEENKSSCSITKTEELIGNYDIGIKNDNFGWVFYYEC